MKKTLFFLLALSVLVLSSAKGQEQEDTKWTWTGWGGGGFFWAAAFDPSNADVLYMGGDVLGVYKSTDRGVNWTLINNGLQNYGIYSIAVSKSNPKTVYVMSEDGMARSDDGGMRWIPLAETRNDRKHLSTNRHGSVRAVAIDPTDPKIVYAGSGRGEAYKSFDGGENWERLDFLSALSVEKEIPLTQAPRGKGFLWLNYHAPKQDWARHGRIEKFINQNGEDWSKYEKLSAKVYSPPGAPKLNATLVVQTGDDWKWLESPVAVMEPGKWTEVDCDLKSLQNIASVRMIHLVFRAQGEEFKGEIGIDEVLLHPKSGGQATAIGDWEDAGNLDGWKATGAQDGAFAKGVRSSLSAKAIESAPIASVVVSQANPKSVFVAHRTLGLFRSDDAGKSWTRPETPHSASHVAVHPENAKLVYGAFGADGILQSTDAGKTWSKTGTVEPAGYKIREIAIDPRDENTVHFIADNSWNGVYGVSRDGGKTWTIGRRWTRDRLSNPSLAADLEKDPGGDLSTPTNLAMSPVDPDVLFISANWTNILSSDGGKTWKQRDQGADITCFHDLRFCGKSVFAVAMDEGLFRSDDNGKTWKRLIPKTSYEEGLSGHQWRVRVRETTDGNFHIVSTVSPWRGAREYPNGVLVSEDGGKTFARASGLPDYLPKADTMWGEGYARALAVDPADPEIMYLGIDGAPENGKSGGGIFKSVDGGKTWRQLPRQPEGRRVFYGLAVDPTDSKRIYWGTGGNHPGVWVSEDGGDSWTKSSVGEWIFNIETTPSGTIYAGGHNLWESRDHGKTWKNRTNRKDGTIVGIAIDPEDENRIWFSSVTWDGSDRGGIFRSVDGGKSWTGITGDIPYKKPLILRYNPQTRELWAVGVGAFRTKQ